MKTPAGVPKYYFVNFQETILSIRETILNMVGNDLSYAKTLHKKGIGTLTATTHGSEG
jgi:hypothetical protein